jgi:hypothetical protein
LNNLTVLQVNENLYRQCCALKSLLKNGIDTHFAIAKMLKRRDPSGEIGCPSPFFSILLKASLWIF